MKVKIKHCEKIQGEIKISGSKNVALPIICACLLTNKRIILENVPMIEDVKNLLGIIKEIGCYVKTKNNKVIIRCKKFNSIILLNKIKKLRGSYYLIGTAIARYGKCITYFPGGCNLGNRPIDLHLQAFKDIGCDVSTYDTILKIEKKRKHLTEINFNKKSVGATINTLLACFRNENIIINNASLEPEVLEVIKFLELLGCNFKITNNKITMQGTLENKSGTFKIISDRIETGSYMLLACAIPNSNLKLLDAPIEYIENIFKIITQLGCNYLIEEKNIILKSNKNLNNIDLLIEEYPSFPTDLQQILTVVLLNSKKQSKIKDLIYPNRLSHVYELSRIGCNIIEEKNLIIINSSKITKGEVNARDLRCAFGMIVASCISEEYLIINNFEIINRGYEKIIEKLNNIGVEIEEYNL